MKSGETWSTLKSQIIFVLSGNFCFVREFFHSLIVFAPSLSVHISRNFFGPSKTAGKTEKFREC